MLEFIFQEGKIESIEEVNADVSLQLFKKAQDALEDIVQDVIQELVSSYPVNTGSVKSNLTHSSVNIPVALIDDSMPGRLRVELGSSARISRLFSHSQSGKNSQSIDDSRSTTIKNSEDELSSRLYRESIIGNPEQQNQRIEELKKKRNPLSNYNSHEDYSVAFISNDSSPKAFTDLNKLVKHIAELIYKDLIKLNK